ncbi:Hypothetical predicted protein [Mytilus galloprovincialis]|nr:Hypothetical predicted protein [Mytilus galloprovincialis]
MFAGVHGKCHAGWVVWRNTCFMFSDIKEDWTQAELRCRAFHGRLLEILDSETNRFVKDHLVSLGSLAKLRVYFVGASDVAKEGTWEWNTNRERFDFTDWGTNQPGGSHAENCLALGGGDGFLWHDYPCHDQHEFICTTENT